MTSLRWDFSCIFTLKVRFLREHVEKGAIATLILVYIAEKGELGKAGVIEFQG